MSPYSQLERKEIGARLRALRDGADNGAGILQTEAAKRIACSVSHYSKIELGQTAVSKRFLRTAAHAFGADVAWLETGEGEMFTVCEETAQYRGRAPADSATTQLETVVDAMLDEKTVAAVRMWAEAAGISLRKAWIAFLREMSTED